MDIHRSAITETIFNNACIILKHKRQNWMKTNKIKFNTNLEHNVTITMTKHDSKTTWIK